MAMCRVLCASNSNSRIIITTVSTQMMPRPFYILRLLNFGIVILVRNAETSHQVADCVPLHILVCCG